MRRLVLAALVVRASAFVPARAPSRIASSFVPARAPSRIATSLRASAAPERRELLGFLKPEPEEEEPPMPEDPELQRVARLFGGLRFVGSNAIMLSFVLDMLAGRASSAALGRVASLFSEWLWPLYATGRVFDVLTRASKRDVLDETTPKLLNVGVLLSLVQLATASTGIAINVIYFAMMPSVLALLRSGVRGLSRGLRFDGRSLSTLYALLSLEAVSTAVLRPRTLPFLRAAALYSMHLTVKSADDEEEETNEAVASHTFRQLNEALQYMSFALFPAGFMKKPALSQALIVPLLSLYAASEGSSLGKKARDLRRELSSGDNSEER